MIIVIHGPPACGKTRNKEALRRHFGCRRIVDGWEAHSDRADPSHHDGSPIRDGDLILTTDDPVAIYRAAPLRGMSFAVHSFAAAIEAASKAAQAGGR